MPIRNSLVFVHRWLGVALCLMFFMWFASGIAMMYWDYPRVSPKERLQHLPLLDSSRVRLTLLEAYGRMTLKRRPDQVTMDTHDGRPAYHFLMGRHQTIVYADDGAKSSGFSAEQARRAASQWTGRSADGVRLDLMNEEDQWTVSASFRALRPLYKFTWPAGDEVYVSSESGEVVQHTTRTSRMGAYFGAIPHWLYFTPLRKNGSLWSKVVIWTSGIATLAALLGLAIGLWMYSPLKRYRHDGLPSSIPYHGQKRLHTIVGLFFGLIACTWVFSGLLSMDPFPLGGSEREKVSSIQAALRGGRPSLIALSSIPAHDVLAKLPRDFQLKELEFTSFAGDPVYVARSASDTRIVTMGGEVLTEFDRKRIVDEVKHAVRPQGVNAVRTVNEYEAYYVDRHQRRPLPVLFVQLNDPQRSMYYIDPRTATIVQSYDRGGRWNRWLYQGLHSLDFPWLYKYRPAWDILVLLLLLGGVALCLTSIIMGWQVIGRKLRRTASAPPLDREKRRETRTGQDPIAH